MDKGKLNILQVNTSDIEGGAAKIALSLFEAYRAMGLGSWLAVGQKVTSDPAVIQIANPAACGAWEFMWNSLGKRLDVLKGRVRGAGRLTDLVMGISNRRGLDRYLGVESFHSPGTRRLLRLTPKRPNIVHCHNLHGGYFDLRVLPWLSYQQITVLTLHDAWLLSGHCSHSFACDRWRSGCGRCPDLSIYPAIRRDATAYNWKRKSRILNRSRLYVVTPSRWLMEKVEASMFAKAVRQGKVIPNGVDLKVFKVADKRLARTALNLPLDAKIVLFAGNMIRKSQFKDYETMRGAISRLAERSKGISILFLALGESGPPEYFGSSEVRFIGFEKRSLNVARYYQAADIYIHAARADTFPNTPLESLACGTPVVATAVGGLSEQIKGWDGARGAMANVNRFSLEDATGVLTPPSDADSLSAALEELVSNEAVRSLLGRKGAADARLRFDENRMVNEYLSWYEELGLQFVG